MFGCVCVRLHNSCMHCVSCCLRTHAYGWGLKHLHFYEVVCYWVLKINTPRSRALTHELDFCTNRMNSLVLGVSAWADVETKEHRPNVFLLNFFLPAVWVVDFRAMTFPEDFSLWFIFFWYRRRNDDLVLVTNIFFFHWCCCSAQTHTKHTNTKKFSPSVFMVV